jgi:hypothetical protein
MTGRLSFSVLWSEDHGEPRAGRLDVSAEGLTLDGGSRKLPARREISLGDVASVEIGRRPHERVSGRTALLLGLRGGGTIAVASYPSAGTLYELAERLWALTGLEPEAQEA